MADFWLIRPELVWGLFSRSLGLVFLISYASLLSQALPVAGSQAGLGMVARRLRKLRQDFPSVRRFAYFPTLLWVNDGDAMIRALMWTGFASAGFVVYGGPISPWALGLCYVCYLSLDYAVGLIFPWDCLLFESTLLGLFIPATLPLPDLAAVAAPAPLLTWAYRLLLFRVMFGFGKQKFLGSRKEDMAYLKGFLINQPLASPLGWLMQKAPVAWLKQAVLFMFIAEIPVPFMAFVPGWPSLVCALVTAALMVGIQAMGSFGYFSVMTIACCIPLLDNSTPTQLSVTQLFVSGAPVFTNVYVLVHTIGAVVVFPFNSWVGQSWSLWSSWYQLPRWVLVPLGFLRALHPFRWLHPYGVFPPNVQPGVKITVMLEVSWDRARWHEVEFVYSPTHPKSPPKFIAPHHPRGDQAVIYDTFGLNPSSLISSLLGPWDPNLYSAPAAAVAFCQSVLEGAPLPMIKAGPLQQHGTPPLAARFTTIMLEPTTIAERRKTGNWWKRTYIGPHTPARERDPVFWQDVFGEPELWHFESIMWRRRSSLQPFMQRALQFQLDPIQLVSFQTDWKASDVERFWTQFVPRLTNKVRSSLDNLPAVKASLDADFSRQEQRVLYRMLNRFALILVARLEPLYLHRGRKPEIHVRTYFHLWMLAHHIICHGKTAYIAAVAHPKTVNNYVSQLTNDNGLFALALFRYDEAVFEAQKLRLIESFTFPHDPVKKRVTAAIVRSGDLTALPKVDQFFINLAQRVSGFFNVAHTVREHFKGPQYARGYPELYPEFRELPSGEVQLVRYRKVTSDTPLASDLKSLPH
ncbi:MAG: hypothetical protein RL701_3564 [Pseudomonadota bacterium]